MNMNASMMKKKLMLNGKRVIWTGCDYFKGIIMLRLNVIHSIPRYASGKIAAAIVQTHPIIMVHYQKKLYDNENRTTYKMELVIVICINLHIET